ncbi:MAG: tRNA (adenosine(37)-N6)-threonylcarbamoyltransferase complex ATPase subunit type 1 TsaE [Bacteroidales bacterium]|jgi:tRNA threonylcarbamoyladenosine biosynthesis protein TsaE|nr:tRNA (adenosine(37)-N6)-threonylcarbamoyltransferase complex ATPase subunit type 1 TsaE [Bacteroidales bacterium]
MQIIINNTGELDRAAGEFLNHTRGRNIFAFYGSMGAGKTTLIKAICLKLGAVDTVTSPSFTLVNEYATRYNDLIYHFDFFRIKTIEEVYDFGFEEYIESGKRCFMEWPEKIEPLLPEETVKVYIGINPDNSRTVDIPG